MKIEKFVKNLEGCKKQKISLKKKEGKQDKTKVIQNRISEKTKKSKLGTGKVRHRKSLAQRKVRHRKSLAQRKKSFAK